MNALMMQAGVELLPGQAARMHGLTLPGGARPAIRLGAALIPPPELTVAFRDRMMIVGGGGRGA